VASPPTRRPSRQAWYVAAGVLLAAIVLFRVYQPALNGPFLFDDDYLPFTHPTFKDFPLRDWVIGVRPMLMLTYWLNYHTSGGNPYPYHLVNVLLHLFSGVLVFLIVRKLLEWAGTETWPREPVAIFAGGLFLLHPLQTEAVAYVASRSENLSVFLFYAAFAVFLYRSSGAISFRRALAVGVLFAAAVASKEHTAVLPALLLLTDYYWNPGFSFQGVKRNWRLYVPVGVIGALGLAFVLSKLAESDTAGFHVKGLPWYLYFATQCKVIWIYVRMFVLPYGQNVDHDYAMATSVFDPLAVAGMAALLGVAGAAWWYRKRFPVASYGVFVFLLLLAPTSSFVPIKDALVERRVYLPMIGLLLVVAGLLRHWRTNRKTMVGTFAALLLVAGLLTGRRAAVWADSVALWSDSVSKTPTNARANFQLAYAYYENQRCSEAVRQYERVATLQKPDYRLLVDWALARTSIR